MAAQNHTPERLKELVRQRLLQEPAPGLLGGDPGQRRLRLSEAVQRTLQAERILLPAAELAGLLEEIADDVLGFGPIEALLRDPAVTEVMVNSATDVFVEREGRIERARVRFGSIAQVVHLVERVVGPLGLRIDESQPYVEARLPDGSRLHAVIPPVSIRGPVVTIRKFSVRPFTPADLVGNGTVSGEMAELLDASVRARLNIVVSGGTGSGKTTLLNTLAASIPPDERVVTIEEAAELRLPLEHVICLEARPPNVEGRGEITVRDLLRNALRMRPDRIIVGEVRGAETLDMLQALNTGHDGSLSTCHANSPRDLLGRLETMAMMAGLGLPAGAIRQQVATALDLVVQTARLPDGSRRVVQLTEVRGLAEDGLELGDLYRYSVRSGFRRVGRPAAGSRLREAGRGQRWSGR